MWVFLVWWHRKTCEKCEENWEQKKGNLFCMQFYGIRVYFFVSLEIVYISVVTANQPEVELLIYWQWKAFCAPFSVSFFGSSFETIEGIWVQIPLHDDYDDDDSKWIKFLEEEIRTHARKKQQRIYILLAWTKNQMMWLPFKWMMFISYLWMAFIIEEMNERTRRNIQGIFWYLKIVNLRQLQQNRQPTKLSVSVYLLFNNFLEYFLHRSVGRSNELNIKHENFLIPHNIQHSTSVSYFPARSFI